MITSAVKKAGAIVLMALLLCVADFVEASDGGEHSPIVAKFYWVDANGESTLDGALAASEAGQFQPFERLLSIGFQSAPVWIRLDLAPGVEGAPSHVLRIRPPWHDEIKLYDPDVLGEQAQVTGDRYSVSIDAYPSLNLNLLVAQAAAPRSLYLKLDTPHSVMLSVELMPTSVALRLDQRQLALFIVYMALLCFVLFNAVVTLLNDREPVIAVFALQLVLALLYAASMYGLLRWSLDGLVSNSVLNYLNNLLIVAYPASTVLFYRVFYSDYGLRPAVARLIDVMLGVSIINLGLIVLGQVQMALVLNAIALSLVGIPLVLAPWLFFTASLEAHPDRLPIWIVRLVTTVMLVFAFTGIQRTLGVAMGDDMALNGFLLHAFLLAILMSIVLRYRAVRRHEALVEGRLEQETRAETEFLARRSMEQFLSMFSHEIKTPLSAVSIVAERGIPDQTLAHQAQQAIDDIDRLVQRCLQVDQAEAVKLPISPEPLRVYDLVVSTAQRLQATNRMRYQGDMSLWATADAWMLEVIVSNLIENALKYAAERTAIRIAIEEKSDGMVSLTVCNQMAVVDDFDRERLFDKFYRGQKASRHSGAGLGLYLSKMLAEQQGGSLSASHEPSGGFCIELRMPHAHLSG